MSEGTPVRVVRLFAASPGDVNDERSKLALVAQEFNSVLGESHGIHVTVIEWRTHAAPGMGRPEQVILDQLGEFQLFVGIMWARFGSPTGVAASGTEEEFDLAYRLWQEKRLQRILFYFCEEPVFLKSDEEIAQFAQVNAFRRKVEGLGLVWTYKRRDEFADVVRPHLFRVLIKEFGKPALAADPAAATPAARAMTASAKPPAVLASDPPAPVEVTKEAGAAVVSHGAPQTRPAPARRPGLRVWIAMAAVAAFAGTVLLYRQSEGLKQPLAASVSNPVADESRKATAALDRARAAYSEGDYATAIRECGDARSAAPSAAESTLRAQILKTVAALPSPDRDYWRPQLKALGEDVP